MGHIRLGKRTEGRQPLVKNFVPLTDLDDIVFGGWDIFPDDVYEAASTPACCPKTAARPARSPLSAIRAHAAVFDPYYVKKLDGTHVKTGLSRWSWPRRSWTTWRPSEARTAATAW